MKKYPLILFVSLLVMLLIVSACVPPAEPEPAEEGRLKVVPPGSIVAEKTIGEWSAEWWKWAYSHSLPNDPFTDVTGEFANLRQSGPVHFQTQSPRENLTRSYTIPADKHILISIIVASISQAEMGADASVENLRLTAKENADMFEDVFLILDGEEVANIAEYREISPEFSFEGALNNVFVEFGGPEGESGAAVSDGYFVMLEPPIPGSTHVIEFGGAMPEFDFKTNNKIEITVATE